MTAVPNPYSKFLLSMATQLVDLTNDDIAIMLLDSYTVGTTQDDAQFVADVRAVATETVGAGYTAGGLSLASPTFTQSGPVFTLTSATDPVWSAAVFSPGPAYAVIYDRTPGTDATNPVITFIDLDGPNPCTGGDFLLALNPSGVATLTAG